MAVLHRKEEKIQAVLGRLPKKYSPDDFVTMFIKLYSKDWGKIKSAYIKASQDKEPGTVIHMPKPELYLKQILEIFLTQNTATTPEIIKEVVIAEPTVVSEKPVKVTKTKAATKKAEDSESTALTEKPVTKPVKTKVSTKKAEEATATVTTKKPKAVAKKKIAD